MGTTFICHNHYSLYLAYMYTLNIKKISNEKIYLIINDQLEVSRRELEKIWDQVVVYPYTDFFKVDAFNKITNILKFYYKIRYRFLTNLFLEETSILFIFKDSGIINKELINIFRKKFNPEIVLIEEGYALYEKHKGCNNEVAKKIIYSMLRLPKPFINTQGYNDNVSAIILKRPEYLPVEKKKNKKIITQSKSLYNREKSTCYLETFYGIESKYMKNIQKGIVILYIGQPISELGIISIDEELKILNKVFENIKEYNIVIKPHHLEKKDKYFKFLNSYKNIEIVSDKMTKVPVELVQIVTNANVIISPWSSATINIRLITPAVLTIYLIKMYEYSISEQIINLIQSYDGDKGVFVENAIEIKKLLEDRKTEFKENHTQNMIDESLTLDELHSIYFLNYNNI